MENPKLTIIVPTKDRHDTLIHCLRTITSQPESDLEILVSDNFSGPQTKEVVDSFSDKRIRYIRTPERLGMAENYEFALSNAKGDWITIIGDDDGLLPGGLKEFFTIANNNPEIKAITFANCWFRWPSENANNGKLLLFKGEGYEIRNCADSLKLIMDGEKHVPPTVYTGGFVKRDVIEKIKSLSPDGQLIRSIIPDVYIAIALCSVLDKYIYSYKPVSIAGASKHSNGRQHKTASQEEKRNLDFYRENKKKFHPTLGDGATEAIQILIYECYLRSSHLRSNDNVKIQEQLEIALIHAGSRTYNNVYNYCKELCRINNLDFQQILKVSNKKRFGYRFNKLAKKFASKIPGCAKSYVINIKDNKVRNIYDASLRVGQKIYG